MHGPVFKPIYVTLLNHQFASQFLPMYNAGVRIDRIFELLGEASTNTKYGNALKTVGYQLGEGESLQNAIAFCPYFTGNLRVHLRTGAKSGNYNQSLQAFLAQQDRKLPRLIQNRAYGFYLAYICILLFLLVKMMDMFLGGLLNALWPG